jgi:imidazolonepropionase-like amidohydrolase
MSEADVILPGGAVLTMDAWFSLFDPGAVAVRGNEIVAVGPADDIAADYEAAEVVDCSGKAVIPSHLHPSRADSVRVRSHPLLPSHPAQPHWRSRDEVPLRRIAGGRVALDPVT